MLILLLYEYYFIFIFIIIFVSLYYGYVGYGQNSDYLSSQWDSILCAAFGRVRRRCRTKPQKYTYNNHSGND